MVVNKYNFILINIIVKVVLDLNSFINNYLKILNFYIIIIKILLFRELEDFNINFPSKYIEYFEYQDLLINITKHILVPKHSILNDSEKKDLLTKYSIKRDTQLPKLYITDPIAKYYGCRKGNIVKVLRDSVASTSYLTYRIVV